MGGLGFQSAGVNLRNLASEVGRSAGDFLLMRTRNLA